MYRPDVRQMTTPIRIQRRQQTTVNGAPKTTYVSDGELDFCNWKSKGGTETVQAGTLVVEDTATVVMWYRPDISQKDRLLLYDDAAQAFDVIGPPENIEQRNQMMLLKVKRAVNT